LHKAVDAGSIPTPASIDDRAFEIRLES